MPRRKDVMVESDMPIWKHQARLEDLYERYNRPEYISPDPLECVTPYKSFADREIAALIAASIAFGNVRQIIRSVHGVLAVLPEPRRAILETPPRALAKAFAAWRHRYVGGGELCGLLSGIRRVLERHGSLESCFVTGYLRSQEDVLPALTQFVDALRGPHKNYLLPSPADGSACKRLNLFLRWMVRHDAVDPGGWTRVCPGKLIVPLDTHMHRMALEMGLTSRRQADLRTAIEITAQFRRIAPADPCRYDFALTRLGIRREDAR